MAFPDTSNGKGAIVKSIKNIAEDDFFDAIEISWIKNPTIRSKAREILESGGLQIGFGAHPDTLSQKLNLNSPDKNQRLEGVRQMKELIDQAGELGSQRFVFLSGPDPGDAMRDSALDALIDSIRQMCTYGRERGIGLIGNF